MEAFGNLSKDVSNYPELKSIVDTITEILEYMGTDEILALKQTNQPEFTQKMEDKFSDFCDKYYSLFSLLVNGEDNSLEHLIMMINTLCMVKLGKISIDTASSHIRDELSEKYIYPKFGGKKKFEDAIIKRSKNKKNN